MDLLERFFSGAHGGSAAQDQRERARQEAAAEREWLEATAPAYEAALANWADVAWCHDALATCRTVLAAVAEYDPATDPSRRAVFILAQARLSLESVFSGLELVEAFEARRAAFEQLLAALTKTE